MLPPKAKYCKNNAKYTMEYLARALEDPTPENLYDALFFTRAFYTYLDMYKNDCIFELENTKRILLKVNGRIKEGTQYSMSNDMTKAFLHFIEYVTEENIEDVFVCLIGHVRGLCKGLAAKDLAMN